MAAPKRSRSAELSAGGRDYFVTRRQMLEQMGAGFGMLSLAGLLGPRGAAASGVMNGVASLGRAHFQPRAKRVIFLFMNGGPSHIDTFDPKPVLQKFAGQQPEGELYKKNK